LTNGCRRLSFSIASINLNETECVHVFLLVVLIRTLDAIGFGMQ
jgi:hypothetical protein